MLIFPDPSHFDGFPGTRVDEMPPGTLFQWVGEFAGVHQVVNAGNLPVPDAGNVWVIRLSDGEVFQTSGSYTFVVWKNQQLVNVPPLP